MVYILATIPFFLNDFTNIYVESFSVWLVIDYACRIVPLWILLFLPWRGTLIRSDLGFPYVAGDRIFFWTLIIGTVSLYAAIFDYGPDWRDQLPWTGIGTVPYDIDSPLAFWDYWFGLALVAVSEEVIFRGLALSACRKLKLHPILIFILPAVIFALIHWSSGSRNMVLAFSFGLILMVPTYRTGSVIPAIIGHYVANLYLFR